MKKLFIIFFILTAIQWNAAAQKMSAGDRLKMITAEENINKDNYDEAYKLYREVHRNNPEHPEVNYQCGKTAFNLKKYNEAQIYLSKAVKVNSSKTKDARMWLGRAEHMLGMLDESLKAFEIFKSTLKGKAAASHLVNEYIYQVNVAKKLMNKPVNVTIKNMGKNINSTYPESNPSITADGKTFIFTTARPQNMGGKKDEVNQLYFQDIWISEKDSVSNEWTEAESIGGELNSDEHDASLSITADGSGIFVYKSIRGGDIYYSKKKKNGTWRTPEAVEGKVNSTYFETGACVTGDKKTMYFISEREGKGKGNGDIWMASKKGSNEYEEPVNLAILNTIDDENAVFIHPNGQTLYFSSNSKESIGGYDIFKSDWVNGNWTAPVNLGYPINTLADELQFCISADGRYGYISTKRDDSFGGYDIYEIDLTSYAIPAQEGTYTGSTSITSGNAMSILKGKVLDKKDGEPMEVTLIVEDPQGKVIAETQTAENGDYLIALTGGLNYSIIIKEKDYVSVKESVYVPVSGSTSLIVNRSFLLEEQ